MARILWVSNAPWSPSGYGEQTAMFVPRLRALGHDVAVAANYGLQAAKFELGDLTVYPASHEWGNPSIATFAKHHQADVVIILADAWVMKPDMWGDLRAAIWAPIDHWPIPPAVLAVLQHERVQPIAMSRFGDEWMKRFKLDSLYVPHGVDTKMFHPQPENRDEIRRELGVPEDAFLVGMVAANKGNPSLPRKSFPQAFEAFSRFSREHRDAWLYVHSDTSGLGGGIALDTLALAVGCPEGRLRFPPADVWQLGLPKQVIANLYSAFDVLLSPSMGEGFGIPIIEAQACGVPVITSDHSAMPELTGAGWVVVGDNWWDALQDSFLIVPSVGSIVRALESAYETRDDQALRAAAREFALQYDADLVTEQFWVPAMEALTSPREIPPLNGGKVSRQVRRAEERKRTKLKDVASER